MLLAYMLPASPSCCCLSPTGQAALCDEERGPPHQEGRWRCHRHISHSQLAQPVELLLLWAAGTSSVVQLRMAGKGAGKHKALKPVVTFCSLLSPCCLEPWVWFGESKFFQPLCSHVGQAMLVSKITAFFPPCQNYLPFPLSSLGTILSTVLKPLLGSSWLCFRAVQQKLKVETVWWDQVVQSTTTHLPKELGHRELKLLHWLLISF